MSAATSLSEGIGDRCRARAGSGRTVMRQPSRRGRRHGCPRSPSPRARRSIALPSRDYRPGSGRGAARRAGPSLAAGTYALARGPARRFPHGRAAGTRASASPARVERSPGGAVARTSAAIAGRGVSFSAAAAAGPGCRAAAAAASKPGLWRPREARRASCMRTRFTAMIRSSASRPACAAGLPGCDFDRTRTPPAESSEASTSSAPASAGVDRRGIRHLRRLPEHGGDGLRLALAQQPDFDRFADPEHADRVAEFRIGPDRLAAHGSDHVARLDAGAGGRRALGRPGRRARPGRFRRGPRLLRNSGVSDSVVDAELAAIDLRRSRSAVP